MTQALFDVPGFGEMLLRLSVPSGERLEAAKHPDIFSASADVNVPRQFGDMVVTNKSELFDLMRGSSNLTR